jgi:steroid delta-isomerase-like uncharacterized protein
MSAEENKAIVRRFLDEAWNMGELSVLDEICAPSYVYHDPANPQVTNLEAYKQYIAAVRAAAPDLQFTAEDVLAEGDKVAVRWTFRGTAENEFQGIPPTGEQLAFTGMNIYRLSQGKIAENWSNWDTLGWLQQVGVIPPLG